MMTIHDDNHNQMFQSNPINILISLLSVTNGVKKLSRRWLDTADTTDT